VPRLALLVATLLLASSCGGSGPTGEAPDLATLLDDAAAAMGGLESARFSMERRGAPVELAGLFFESAEGVYLAPDAAKAILRVKVADVPLDLGTIAIAERVWLTNPLTGGWEEIPEGTGFNIAVIFDPGVGWVPLLTDDLAGAEYRGFGSDGSGRRYVVNGTIAAGRVSFLTAGLVEAQSVEADIWIDPVTGHITRVEFATVRGGDRTDWVIRMWDFDAPAAVDPPAGY